MQHYSVTGMSCAACSSRVEKAVSKVSGVTECSVSLLTNSMSVEGTASPEEVIRAVENAGYGAKIKGAGAGTAGQSAAPSWADDEALKDHETPKLRKRLMISAVLLLVLMYFSMGHMMWGFPAPAAFENHVFLGVFEMLLAIAVSPLCLLAENYYTKEGNNYNDDIYAQKDRWVALDGTTAAAEAPSAGNS